jgi:hypothetical protein
VLDFFNVDGYSVAKWGRGGQGSTSLMRGNEAAQIAQLHAALESGVSLQLDSGGVALLMSQRSGTTSRWAM